MSFIQDMSINQNYVYSINNVIHIDDSSATKRVVVGNSLVDTRNSYNDPNITSQFRVIGGLWTDTSHISKILPHNDDQGYERNTLRIGESTSSLIYIQGKRIDIGDGQFVISQEEGTLTINDNTDTPIVLNDTEKSITIGKPNATKETYIHGESIYIGEPGKYTYILGNLVTFGEGSPHDPSTTSASSFTIHNTGSRTALTVIQDNNSAINNEDLAVFITSSNQDRAPLRIDGTGRVGMGLLRDSDVGAWLHINKNDYGVTTNTDLFLAEDEDNDVSPFVIKSDGRVGIGTKEPEYGLDVSCDIGVVVRNPLYLTNSSSSTSTSSSSTPLHKISTVLGGDLRDVEPSNVTGFNMCWETQTETQMDSTHIFRVHCKLHLSFENGNMCYRRYDLFINPSNFDNPLVNVAEVYDNTVNTVVMEKIVVERKSSTDYDVYVPWIFTENEHQSGLGYRNYMEIEVLCHRSLNFFVFNEKKYV